MTTLAQMKADMDSHLTDWGTTYKVYRYSNLSYDSENKASSSQVEVGTITGDLQPGNGRVFRDERGLVIDASYVMYTTFDADVVKNDVIKTDAGVTVGVIMFVGNNPEHKFVLIKE